MEFTLNGRPVSVEMRGGESLLDLLRERCGLTSMKDGCAPEGSCGACTVLVDGKAAVSCAQPAARVAGKSVTTLEGLPAERRTQWADSFVAAGASQCGFCSPGIVMKAEALLERNPAPSREEIIRSLAGNLCRCTGYIKIIEAVQYAAAAGRGEPVPAPHRTRRGGSRARREQGRGPAPGLKPPRNDPREPGMLYGAIRWSDP